MLAQLAVRRRDGGATEAESLGEVALGRQPGVDGDAPVEDEQAHALGERLVGAAVTPPLAEQCVEGAGTEGGFRHASHFIAIGFLP